MSTLCLYGPVSMTSCKVLFSGPRSRRRHHLSPAEILAIKIQQEKATERIERAEYEREYSDAWTYGPFWYPVDYYWVRNGKHSWYDGADTSTIRDWYWSQTVFGSCPREIDTPEKFQDWDFRREELYFMY